MLSVLIFLAMPFLSGTDVPRANLVEIRGEATAPGSGRIAGETAIRNAQLAVVIECLESMTSARDLAPFEGILSSPQDYIHSFDVCRSEQTEGGARVEIEARVNQARLRHDVARIVFPGVVPAPRVLLLVGESLGNSAEPVAEPFLGNALTEKRLVRVDAAPLHERYTEAELLAMLGGETALAASAGREMLADVVICGSVAVTSDDGTPGCNVLANRARLCLNVIRADTGRVVDEIRKEAVVRSIEPAVGGREAIQDACARSVDDLVVASVIAMLNEVPETDIMLAVEGLHGSGKAAPIAEAIQANLGATEVQTLYESEASVRFRVAYDGSIEAFAEELTSPSFSACRLRLRRLVNRDMAVEVVE